MSAERIVECQADVPERPWFIHHHKCLNIAKGVRGMGTRTDGRILTDAPACGVHLRAKYAPTRFDPDAQGSVR